MYKSEDAAESSVSSRFLNSFSKIALLQEWERIDCTFDNIVALFQFSFYFVSDFACNHFSMPLFNCFCYFHIFSTIGSIIYTYLVIINQEPANYVRGPDPVIWGPPGDHPVASNNPNSDLQSGLVTWLFCGLALKNVWPFASMLAILSSDRTKCFRYRFSKKES